MRKSGFTCAEWVSEQGKFTAFATVTFKQGRTLDDGRFMEITREEAEETCEAIRDRLFKKLRRKFRWVTSIETGHGEKRMHAHMAIEVPKHVEFSEFQNAFLSICHRMRWVRRICEVTEIIDNDGDCGSRRVIFYMFKEGVDALAVHASTLRI